MSEIYPLFSTPVFKTHYDGPPFEDLIKFCKSSETRVNKGNNYTSLNNYALNDPIFLKLRKFIEASIKEYIDSMEWQNEFYITQSWFNVNPTGTGHHEHYHLNSIVSGSFYLNAGKNDFITFHSGQRPAIGLTTNAFNIMNSPSWDLEVATNDLILFPSQTLHSVKPNPEPYERISLAFNTFVRGTLGLNENLTHLKL
jgi:uncharacterized protein (TIGR02466 family)